MAWQKIGIRVEMREGKINTGAKKALCHSRKDI